MKHTSLEPPKRIVILGATGVLGKALIPALEDFETLSLGRGAVDLCSKEASKQLASYLKPGDAVVMLSAITPDKGRGVEAFQSNIEMMKQVCLACTSLSHFVYLSSDAVYSFRHMVVDEQTPADPEDLYGIMHRTREILAQTSISAPVAILRTTLVYSEEDTHNSYGPNRMRRSAMKEGVIKLFGQGEEMRDHVAATDVARLIRCVLERRSQGLLNVATGQSISYADLAHKVAKQFDEQILIQASERQNPITHRHFDVTAIFKAFPHFTFQSLDVGIEQMHKLERQKVKI